MVGGVERKISSEIILWSSLRVTCFESRTTQGLASVTGALWLGSPHRGTETQHNKGSCVGR